MAKYGSPVTNQSLIDELEGMSSQPSNSPKYGPPVTDPALLERLEGGKQTSFNDLSEEDQKKAMDLAKQQISQQYPNLPNWLRDMMLTVTPKDQNPRLQKMAANAQADTNGIPVVAGGLMQGVATPFQGVASMIPGETAKNFANQDFTDYLPKPQNDTESAMQTGAEFLGGLGPVGKLFGMLKGGTKLAGIPKALQNATALAGTGAIATPGDAVNKALGAAGAVTLGGAAKVGSSVANQVPVFLRGLTNDATPKSLFQAIQKPHDILSNTADELYDYVRRTIKKRNVNVNINPNTLDEILDYPTMQSKTHKELVDRAKLGDYDAIHKLQSSLYKKGSKDLLNEDAVIETRGENTLDLRNRINKELENDLTQKGHGDITHVLRQGKNTFKKIMDTYYNKNLREAGGKGIGKLVNEDLRVEPKNATSLLDTTSKPMNVFLKQHPEAAQQFKGLQEKNAAKKALKDIFIKGGAAGGLAFGGKTILDLL
jgi:hypothetical protein